MSIKLEFRDGIVYAEISGELTFDIAFQHLRRLEEISENTEPLKELLDFTNCEQISLSSAEINQAAEQGKWLSQSSTYILAICAPTDLHYGLSRMFQTFQELAGNKFEIQIFRDLASAQEWLEK